MHSFQRPTALPARLSAPLPHPTAVLPGPHLYQHRADLTGPQPIRQGMGPCFPPSYNENKLLQKIMFYVFLYFFHFQKALKPLYF